MSLIYVMCALAIIGVIGAFYWLFTIDSYIVRVRKNQVMEFRSSMDLSGLPIITFYQGKKKYNFLLDTGSNISYVNIKSDVEVEKTGTKDVFMGASGEDLNCEGAKIKLYHGDIEYDCNVSIADLDNAFTELKNCYGVTLTGILGNNFFTKYQYCLDFKELVCYARK